MILLAASIPAGASAAGATSGSDLQRGGSGAQASLPTELRVWLADPTALEVARQEAGRGAPGIQQALNLLREEADRAARARPVSVRDKSRLAPSGDPGDYVSLAIYYWPNPDTPSGLPYVSRDGIVNPEYRDPDLYDRTALVRMKDRVQALSLAYFLLGDERYAVACATQLRAWFIDGATRMNPHLTFAQMRPPRVNQSGSGIIESRALMIVTDAVGLLEGSGAWTLEDQEALEAWFSEFVDWLTQSPPGQRESQAANNHGAWYDAQVTAFALFARRPELAEQRIAEGAARLVSQIEPNGRQPAELARTRPLHYSLFNLDAYAKLALLGRHLGWDLWSLHTASGTRMRAALDFLVPYVSGAEALDSGDVTPVAWFREMAQILAAADRAYPDGNYGELLATLSAGQNPLQLLKLRLGLMWDF